MSTLPEYFGAAYLINLPDRTDRLESAKKELEHVGWRIGPSGVGVFPARKFSEKAGFPSAGARGAFYSHWECLQRASAENQRSVLILEDDIAFSSSLAKLTPSLISRLDAIDWDFVFFGHSETGAIPNAHSKTEPSQLKFEAWTRQIQGLHFYAINGRLLARLNAHLERVACGAEGDQEAGPMPVDGAINNFRRMNTDVRAYIVHPKLGWQRPSRSDIMPGTLDRYRVLRPLTTTLRDLKHVIKSWRS